MKLFMMSVFDNVGEEFAGITLEPSVESAKRSFVSNVTSAMANKVGLLYTATDDFDLYHMGNFDTETGDFETFNQNHICVMSGSDAKLLAINNIKGAE